MKGNMMNSWLVIHNGTISGPYTQHDALNRMASLDDTAELYEMVKRPTSRRIEYKVHISATTTPPPVPVRREAAPPQVSPVPTMPPIDLPLITEDPDSEWSGKSYRENNRRRLFNSEANVTAEDPPVPPLFDRTSKDKPSKIKGLFGK